MMLEVRYPFRIYLQREAMSRGLTRPETLTRDPKIAEKMATTTWGNSFLTYYYTSALLFGYDGGSSKGDLRGANSKI